MPFYRNTTNCMSVLPTDGQSLPSIISSQENRGQNPPESKFVFSIKIKKKLYFLRPSYSTSGNAGCRPTCTCEPRCMCSIFLMASSASK